MFWKNNQAYLIVRVSGAMLLSVADVDAVLGDLRIEGDQLDTLVATLPEDRWATPTPAEGWTITHQIAHLSWTDAVALRSAVEAPSFQDVVDQALREPDGFVDKAAEEHARVGPATLLSEWRTGRAELLAALEAVPAGRTLEWFGPPMSVASMATARIMETWAHGQDIVDALGITRAPTARLQHVAHIGVRTRDFAYAVREQPPPSEPFHVELTGPDGQRWAWGPHDAAQRITGPALDFCLLVTQRRHRDDLALESVGDDAAHWLSIAQAFAGRPGNGRKAGQFT